MLKEIGHELKHHAPFTFGGTVLGAALLAAIVLGNVSHGVSERLFAVFHPAHILFSAIATAGIYRVHSRGRWWAVILVGYVGAIGVGTLSDSLIPYAGEALFAMHDVHVHADHARIGFLHPDLWYVVNPAAIVGSWIGLRWPKTRVPHGLHVLLSSAASLFHMTMAVESGVATWVFFAIPAFLFLAVWLPCCTSDIVFPLLLVPKERRPALLGCCHDHGSPAPGDAAPDRDRCD